MYRDAKMTRRAALRGAAAIGLAGLGPSISAAQSSPPLAGDTKLTVTGYFRTPAFLIAGHKGYFSKERLDVDFHLVRLAPEHNAGLAQGRWVVSHAIDPEIDKERDKVAADLIASGLVASARPVTRPNPLSEGLTATGATWKTDGRLFALELK